MEVWDGYLERQRWGIFLKLRSTKSSVCVCARFFLHRSICKNSQQKDAECIINSFSLHKLLCDPLMFFWRRYPFSTQALPWWPPGRNGNNVFSSFGASKKVTLDNLPNHFWSWSRQRFFFGQTWTQQKIAPEKTDVENRWDIFLFWLHNPHEKWKKLPTYLNWLDLVHE